jgi:hypothetical protein
MSWYHFHCNSGAGHQSFHETYRWIDAPNKDDLECYWEDWVRDGYWHDAIGGIDKVKSLPKEWHERLVDKYKNRILHSREMLVLLGKTPVRAPKRVARKEKTP